MALSYSIKFKPDTSEIASAIDKIDKDIAATADKAGLKMTEAFAEGITQAEILSNALKKAQTVDGTSYSALNKQLLTAGTSAEKMADALSRAGMTSTLNELNLQLATADRNLTQINSKVAELQRVMTQSIKFNMAMAVQNFAVDNIQAAVTWVKELDSALHDIAVVAPEVRNNMDDLAATILQGSMDLKVAASSYAEAALIFYQQGLDPDEVKARTDVTILAAKASGTAVADMSSQLTAIWNTYQMTGDQMGVAAAVAAELGAKTAASFADIATGMQTAASGASLLGVSYNSLASIISTVRTATQQSTESISTAYKTIFARFSNLSTSGEDAGESLGQITQSLADMGIHVLDATGSLKDLDDVIYDCGINWENYTRNQQIAIAQTVGGTRQYQQFLSLMQNFDEYQKNLAIADGVTDISPLMEQYETAIQTIDTAATLAAESWSRAFSQIFSDDAQISFYQSLEKAGDEADRLITALGGIEGVLSIAGALLLTKITPVVTSLSASISSLWTNRSEASQAANIAKDYAALTELVNQRLQAEIKSSNLSATQVTAKQKELEVEKTKIALLEQAAITAARLNKIQSEGGEAAKLQTEWIKTTNELATAQAQEALDVLGAAAVKIQDLSSVNIVGATTTDFFESKAYQLKPDTSAIDTYLANLETEGVEIKARITAPPLDEFETSVLRDVGTVGGGSSALKTQTLEIDAYYQTVQRVKQEIADARTSALNAGATNEDLQAWDGVAAALTKTEKAADQLWKTLQNEKSTPLGIEEAYLSAEKTLDRLKAKIEEVNDSEEVKITGVTFESDDLNLAELVNTYEKVEEAARQAAAEMESLAQKGPIEASSFNAFKEAVILLQEIGGSELGAITGPNTADLQELNGELGLIYEQLSSIKNVSLMGDNELLQADVQAVKSALDSAAGFKGRQVEIKINGDEASQEMKDATKKVLNDFAKFEADLNKAVKSKGKGVIDVDASKAELAEIVRAAQAALGDKRFTLEVEVMTVQTGIAEVATADDPSVAVLDGLQTAMANYTNTLTTAEPTVKNFNAANEKLIDTLDAVAKSSDTDIGFAIRDMVAELETGTRLSEFFSQETSQLAEELNKLATKSGVAKEGVDKLKDAYGQAADSSDAFEMGLARQADAMASTKDLNKKATMTMTEVSQTALGALSAVGTLATTLPNLTAAIEEGNVSLSTFIPLIVSVGYSIQPLLTLGTKLPAMINTVTAAVGALSPALLVAAAAVAAVVAVIGIVAYQSKAAERELAALKATSEKMTEAFAEAKTAADELANSIEAYSDLKSTLDDLVVGTEEWTTAMEESNEAALTLLNTYKELYQLDGAVTYENGVIIIDPTALETVLDSYEKAMQGAQATATLADAQYRDEALRQKITSYGLTTEQVAELSEGFSGERAADKGVAETVLGAGWENNITIEGLYSLVEAMRENTAQSKLEYELNAANFVSEDGRLEGYENEEIAFIARYMASQKSIDRLDWEAQQAGVDAVTTTDDEYIGKIVEALRAAGYEDVVVNSRTKYSNSGAFGNGYYTTNEKGQQELIEKADVGLAIYQAELVESFEEIGQVARDTLLDILESGKDYSSILADLLGDLNIDDTSVADRNALSSAIGEAARGAEVDLYAALGVTTSDSLMEAQVKLFLATEFGAETEDELQAIFDRLSLGSLEEGAKRVAAILENAQLGVNSFNEIETKVTTRMDIVGGGTEGATQVEQLFNTFENVELPVVDQFGEKLLSGMSSALSGEGMTDFITTINDILAGVEPENYTNAIEAIMGVDWTSSGAILALESNFANFGETLGLTGTAATKFFEQMSAIEQINWGTELVNATAALEDYYDTVSKLTDGSQVSAETYAAIIAANADAADLFIKNVGAGYTYLGEATDLLDTFFNGQSLQNGLYTVLQIKKTAEEMKDSDYGELWDIDGTGLAGFADEESTMTAEDLDNILNIEATAQMIASLVNQGHDISIEGFRLAYEDYQAALLDGNVDLIEATRETFQQQATLIDGVVTAIPDALAEERLASTSDDIFQLITWVDEGTVSIETFNKALDIVVDKNALKFDLDLDEVENATEFYHEMADQLAHISDEAKYCKATAAQLAIQFLRFEKGVDSVVDSMEDWEAVLSDVGSADLSDVSAALAEVDIAMSDLLDLDYGTLSADFLIDNLGLLNEAAYGSVEALEALRQATQVELLDNTYENFFDSMVDDLVAGGVNLASARQQVEEALGPMSDFTGGIIAEMQEELDKLSHLDVAGVDATELAWSLENMLAGISMSVDDAKALYKSFGMDVEFDQTQVETKQTVPVTTVESEQTGWLKADAVGPGNVPYEIAIPNTRTVTTTSTDTVDTGGVEMISFKASSVEDGEDYKGVVKNATYTAPSSMKSSTAKTTSTSSSSSGSSSTPAPSQSSKVRSSERYTDTTTQINAIASSLEKLSSAETGAFGAAKLALITSKNAKLQEQAQAYTDLITEAREYYELDDGGDGAYFGIDTNGIDIELSGVMGDADRLQQKLDALGSILPSGTITLGLEAEFNEEGYVSNREAIMNQLRKDAEAYYDANAYLYTDDDGNSYMTLSAYAQGVYDSMNSLIDGVGTQMDVVDETTAKIMEAIQINYEAIFTWMSDKITEAQLKTELRVTVNENDISQVERAIRNLSDEEYTIKLDAIVENTDSVLANIYALFDEYARYEEIVSNINMDNQEWFIEKFSEEAWELYKASGEIPVELMTAMTATVDDLIAEMDRLYDYNDEVWSSWFSALDTAQAKFDTLFSKMETYSDMISTYLSIWEKVGDVWNNSDVTVSLLNKQLEAQSAEMEATMAQIESYNAQLEMTTTLYEAAVESQGADSQIAQDYADEISDLEQQILEAQAGLLSDLDSFLDTLADASAAAATVITDSFVDALDGLFADLESAMTMYNQYSTLSNYHVSEIEAGTTIKGLLNEVQEMMANTTDPAQLAELEKYEAYYQGLIEDQIVSLEIMGEMQEVTVTGLAEGVELTQAQLDIMQAEFDLMKEEAAWEEAQANKNTMRLARDASGNYSYVYSTDDSSESDADALTSLEESYADLIKLHTDAANTASELYLQLFTEYAEYMQSVDQARYEQDEDYKAEVDQREQWYSEQLGLYAGSISYHLEAVGGSFEESVLGVVTGTDSMEECHERYMKTVDVMVADLKENYEYYDEVANAALDSVGLAHDDLAINVEDATDIIVDNVNEISDAIKNMAIESAEYLAGVESRILAWSQWWQTACADVIDAINAVIQAQSDLYKNELDESGILYDADTNYTAEMFSIAADLSADKYDFDNASEMATVQRNLISLASETANKVIGLDAYDYYNGFAIEGMTASEITAMNTLDASIFGQNYGNIQQSIYDLMGGLGEGEVMTEELYDAIYARWAKMMAAVNGEDVGEDISEWIAKYNGQTVDFEQFILDEYGTINGIQLTIEDILAAFGITLQSNATGGLVTSPTISTLAEEGSELVLNHADTENLLEAIQIMRDGIANRLSELGVIRADTIRGTDVSTGISNDNRSVTINAEFPNVSVKSEIEDAFANLINEATQYQLK